MTYIVVFTGKRESQAYGTFHSTNDALTWVHENLDTLGMRVKKVAVLTLRHTHANYTHVIRC